MGNLERIYAFGPRNCAECDGTGHYFVDKHGHFVAIHRFDDMHEMKTCEECSGTGIEEICEDYQIVTDGEELQ